jgi:hypothetical protein
VQLATNDHLRSGWCIHLGVAERDHRSRLRKTSAFQLFFARVVIAVLNNLAVCRAVVLGDQAGLFVEKIGDSQQVAEIAVDRCIDKRTRQTGIDHPDDA